MKYFLRYLLITALMLMPLPNVNAAGWLPLAGGACSAVLTIDVSGGGNHANTSGAISVAPTITTSNSNVVIIVDASPNGGPVVSVVGSAGIGTFTKLSSGGTLPFVIERWWAIAASPLTAATVTVTQTTSAFMSVNIYGVSGANTSSPFDSGGTFGNVDPISITTTNANDMLITGFRGSTASPTAGSGWTIVPNSGADFTISESELVSAIGTYSGSMTTGAGQANGAVIDGVKRSC